MKTYMMKLILLIYMLMTSSIYAVTADELMQLHSVTTAEMNAISTPQAGSVVYNSTENTLFFYTGSVWKKMRANGTETIINAGSGMTVTGDGSNTTPYTVGIN